MLARIIMNSKQEQHCYPLVMERKGTADGSSNKIINSTPARASATSNNQAGVSATGSKNNETKSTTTAADESKKKPKRN